MAKIKVERTEPTVVSRTYVGLVADRAEADDAETAWTVRVDGHDVLAALTGDMDRLARYRSAVFVVNGTRFEGKGHGFSVDTGEPYSNCADGCCADGSEPGIYVDRWRDSEANVLEFLGGYHGHEASFTYRLIGRPEPLVTVTLAHHTEHAKPGDQMKVPLDTAMRLCRSGRVITEQHGQVAALARKVAAL